MAAQSSASPWAARRQQREGRQPSQLGRAIGYLGRFRKLASLAYLSLLISTGAQLMVPQLVQNIIDAVTRGMIASKLTNVPAAMLTAALAKVGMTQEQLESAKTNPETAIYWALVLIIVFAVARGLFAFSQAFLGESVSQNIAFDLRNELFAKIQRLSFSYHDRNRTGQLMIRATDDVEKLRLFVGQGLLMSVQALVLLVSSLALLFATNWSLTLTVIAILPLALVIFMVFGRVTQPLFGVVQRKLSALNTILQENLAGIKVVQAFPPRAGAISAFQDLRQRSDGSADQGFTHLYLSLPADLFDGESGSGGCPRSGWQADHPRTTHHRRMAKV